MKHNSFHSACPTRKETRWGLGYLAFSLLLLPWLLKEGNALLASPLSHARLNFVYYAINFLVVVFLCRKYLGETFRAGLRSPFAAVWYALLGYLGSQALGELLLYGITVIKPDFYNVNDLSVGSMLQGDYRLVAMGVVFLVPVAEETLYRGLIFRNLLGKNRWAAYLVSMALFSAMHVVGYIGVYTPVHLLLCFLQYLPPAFCLCWCYHQTGTLAAPVIMHTICNAMAAYSSLT